MNLKFILNVLSSIFGSSEMQHFETKFYETGNIRPNPVPRGLASLTL